MIFLPAFDHPITREYMARYLKTLPDLMTLSDEDGNEITFEVIDALDHKGVHYLAVVEYVEDEADLDEDAQLVILRVGSDAEGEYLDVVDDDETLMEVGALFEKRLSDSFDIG